MTEEHHNVVIVGSGFAGLGTAIELKRDGCEDFVMLERADALGGTWRANHYPGCACDVPTPYYSFSFAPKPDWSRFYAPYGEIRAYLEECADRFGVRGHLRTGTTVTALRWSDDDQRWTVEVDGAPAMTADMLVAAPGGLSRPAYPDIEGLADFTGPWFHSAEWDHAVDLTGARVAVVGTGASAIQFVPQIAPQAAHVDVFQRTPPWVIPKPDRRIPKAEQWLYRRAPRAQRLVRGGVWAMQEWMGLGNTVSRRFTRPLEARGRAEIHRSIEDPELRARLTPDYAIGCKRLLLANDWYPALARENVDVVSDSIARANENGLVTTAGVEHPADVIIFGTGFHATDPLGQLPVEGRGGITLAERWREGMQAHRGTTIAGFPNFFLMPGPNTGTGHTSPGLHDRGPDPPHARGHGAGARSRRRLDRAARGGAGRLQRPAARANGAHRVAARRLLELVPRRPRAQHHPVAGLVARLPSCAAGDRRPRVPLRGSASARAATRPRHHGGPCMSFDLNGRTVLITGAARGIGAEAAARLHARGANLALVGLEPDLLEQSPSGSAIAPRSSWPT